MPPTKKFNRPQLFGPDCVFAITDWKGFTGAAAQEYATIGGTIVEIATPYGYGMSPTAGVASIEFNLTSLLPLTLNPRSVFAQFYLSSITPAAGNYSVFFRYGNNALRNAFWVYVNNAGAYGGGGYTDFDEGGTYTAGTWATICVTNTGANGGANIVYASGLQVASGTNGGALVTSYQAPTVLRDSGGLGQCAYNSIIQNVIVFSRVLTPAEVLDLHNKCIGNSLY